MKASDFYFDLPQELIAQYPTNKRGESRLLVLNREDSSIADKMVTDFIDYIPSNSLLVFNNSKVRKARLIAKSETGGNVELLWLEKISDDCWKVICNRAHKQTVGKKLYCPDSIVVTIIEDQHNIKIIKLSQPITEDYFEKNGKIPLPPYIKRDTTENDNERYQTVFSKTIGSSAAPTAGLHFTKEMLANLEKKGVEIVYVTLHVGIGTFLPIKTENVEEHKMHTETYFIEESVANKINQAKKDNRLVYAVGTTSVRTLESAYKNGEVQAGEGATNIFIYPGYKFNVVDKLWTNFHTPDSTLILLVSAFAGSENIKKSYKYAIENKFRFFSYGDAMLII